MNEKIQSSSKVAYRMLSNDLKSQDTTCAYLFVGAKNTGKLQVAKEFCASLICQHTIDGWACGKCELCNRVLNDGYTDIKVIYGEDSIKKDQISELQDYFTKTSFEAYGKKAYIIEDADTMTLASMNSILKFLEEPGQDITAILLTEHPDRLLPTILSRCKLIPFKEISSEKRKQIAIDKGMDTLDSHILSRLIEEDKLEETSELEEYQVGLKVWLDFIKSFNKDIDHSIYITKKTILEDKNKQKDIFSWFLNVGIIFCEDYIEQNNSGNNEWDLYLKSFKDNEFMIKRLLMVLLHCKDELLIHANSALLVDRFAYEIKEA